MRGLQLLHDQVTTNKRILFSAEFLTEYLYKSIMTVDIHWVSEWMAYTGEDTVPCKAAH